MRQIIKIIILSFLFYSSCNAAEVKTMESENSNPQVELIHFSILADGGTMGFIIKDNEGKTIKFCFDGRISSNTKGELYIGDDHPKTAQVVARGSKESKMLISLLQEYISYNFKEEVNSLIIERIKAYKNS